MAVSAAEAKSEAGGAVTIVKLREGIEDITTSRPIAFTAIPTQMPVDSTMLLSRMSETSTVELETIRHSVERYNGTDRNG